MNFKNLFFKNSKIYFCITFILCISYKKDLISTAVGLYGFMQFANGVGNHLIPFYELRSKNLITSCLTPAIVDSRDLPNRIKENIKFIQDYGDIIIYADVLWTKHAPCKYIEKLNNFKIKIAISVTETDKIPHKWVEILNNYFDMVIVPSKHLVKIYEKSGVKIPIFHLPLMLYFDDMIKAPQSKKNEVFTFGMIGGFGRDKNHEELLNSFIEVFGNNSSVKLKLKGKYPNSSVEAKLKDIIMTKKITNVELITEDLNRNDYINFFKSLDAYVLVSRGEGFSITPREALALAKPCILSDHSAHHAICKKGFARSVKAQLFSDSDNKEAFSDDKINFDGRKWNVELKDISDALIDVYNNYDYYLEKAKEGREWVKKYLPRNLRSYYLNVVQPKKIILADKNEITNRYFMTNSVSLYNKYKSLQK